MAGVGVGVGGGEVDELSWSYFFKFSEREKFSTIPKKSPDLPVDRAQKSVTNQVFDHLRTWANTLICGRKHFLGLLDVVPWYTSCKGLRLWEILFRKGVQTSCPLVLLSESDPRLSLSRQRRLFFSPLPVRSASFFA